MVVLSSRLRPAGVTAAPTTVTGHHGFGRPSYKRWFGTQPGAAPSRVSTPVATGLPAVSRYKGATRLPQNGKGAGTRVMATRKRHSDTLAPIAGDLPSR